MIRRACPLLIPFLLPGCVSTAATVATAPFRAAGKAVDLATTSPSERDHAYTRRMRKQQEREDEQRREAAKRCRKHPDDTGCEPAQNSRRPLTAGTSPAR